MKQKLTAIIFALILSLSVTAGLIACDKQGGNKNQNGTVKASAAEVYAISAFSGANYLSATEEVKSIAMQSTAMFSGETAILERPTEINGEAVTEIKNCLTMFESALTSGAITETVEENTTDDEELKKFKYVMIVKAENSAEVKMYYNELDSFTKEEVSADGETEKEVSTILEGVLVLGEERFSVRGKREVETENDETETSIEFITYSNENSGNYVKIEYSVEIENGREETSYEYEIFNNGVSVQKTEIEVENKDGLFELKIELESDNEEKEFKVVGAKDNRFVIKYELNDEEVKITVTKTAEGYLFEYKNGYTETVPA